MGSSVSDKQTELILALLAPYGCCSIFTDGNEAGQRCAAELFERIAPHRLVRKIPLAEDCQPTDCEKEELGRLLALPGQTPVAERASGRATKMRLLTKAITRRHAIVELAQSFPSLAGCEITVKTWNPDAFDEQACRFEAGQRRAAQFVLEVWSGDRDWKSGIFSIAEAMSVWDEPHRKAFIAWAADSWS